MYIKTRTQNVQRGDSLKIWYLDNCFRMHDLVALVTLIRFGIGFHLKSLPNIYLKITIDNWLPAYIAEYTKIWFAMWQSYNEVMHRRAVEIILKRLVVILQFIFLSVNTMYNVTFDIQYALGSHPEVPEMVVN